MRTALFFSLWLWFNPLLVAQLIDEHFYGATGHYARPHALLALPDDQSLRLWHERTGDPVYLRIRWEVIDRAGKVMTTGGYDDPLYNTSVRAAAFRDGHLHLLLRRQRRATTTPVPLRLARFTPAGELLDLQVVPATESIAGSLIRWIRTHDGGYVFGFLDIDRLGYTLRRYDAAWKPVFERHYSMSGSTFTNPINNPLLLHEWPDGRVLSVVPYRNFIALYAHTPDGTLLRGAPLTGTGDAPLATTISTLVVHPSADTVDLLGLYRGEDYLTLPGALRLTAGAVTGQLSVVSGSGAFAPLLWGHVLPDAGGTGYRALVSRGSVVERIHADADWTQTARYVVPQLHPTTSAGNTLLHPSGAVTQWTPLPDEALIEVRAIGPQDDERYREKLPLLPAYAETGTHVRELPNGEILVVGKRILPTGGSHIWLLWLDQAGELLRDRTWTEHPDREAVDVCITPDGGGFLVTQTHELYRFDASGTIRWRRNQMYASGLSRSHYLHALSEDDIFMVRAGRLARLNPETGFPTSMVFPNPNYELQDWTYFNGAFHLVSRSTDLANTFLLHHVSPDERIDELRVITIPEAAAVEPQHVVHTDEHLHVLLRYADSTSTPLGFPVFDHAEEFVYDTSGQLVRRTPIFRASPRAAYPGPGNDYTLRYHDGFAVRAEGRSTFYPLDHIELRDATRLHDGRLVFTGHSSAPALDQQLYVGFTRALPEPPTSATTDLRVYPNPTNGTLSWEAHADLLPTGATAWRLYDSLGRLVRSEAIPSARSGSVSFFGLPTGTYYLEVGAGAVRQGGLVVFR